MPTSPRRPSGSAARSAHPASRPAIASPTSSRTSPSCSSPTSGCRSRTPSSSRSTPASPVAEVETILRHSGARILVADTQLLETIGLDPSSCPDLEEVVAVDDVGQDAPFETTPYAELLARADGSVRPWRVDDEERVISINYTSGTTGSPKGVMYTHRGAYLNALAEVFHSDTTRTPSTCGRCRCSTATAGARPGASPGSVDATSAFAPSTPR